jgi:hypothetical protein
MSSSSSDEATVVFYIKSDKVTQFEVGSPYNLAIN